MQDMQSENAVIELNRAHLWQIALFSLNNTSTNLYLAMMGYVSYYANGIAGLSGWGNFFYSDRNENL